MNLRNQLPGGLTLEGLETATVDEIDRAICKVGFHNTKCVKAAQANCESAELTYLSV